MSAPDGGPVEDGDVAGGDVANELARCRAEIERIDAAIVELLARRMALGRRTGALKREAGMPILDPTREAAVIRRATTLARDAGIAPEAVREVFWQIVGMSRRAQEDTRA